MKKDMILLWANGNVCVMVWYGMICVGDFSNTGGPNDIIALNKWLETAPFKYKVVIAGMKQSLHHDIRYHLP
jgi:hypothetical protein